MFLVVILCFVFAGCSYSGTPPKKLDIQKLLKNGNFEHWFHGKNLPPDCWRFRTSGGGIVVRESKEKLINSYSVSLRRGTSYIDLWQNIPVKYLKGKTVTFSCWAKCNNATGARLRINDGIGASYSLCHTGRGDWELLTVTRTIDDRATSVILTLYVDTDSVIAYFDDAKLVEEGGH